MPTGDDPPPPGFHDLGAVQANGSNRGSATGRLSDDDIPLRAPAEMSRPDLLARVEEPHHVSGNRIGSGYPVALVIVAHGAREPEVFPEGGPAERLGDDVVNLHRRACDA